MHRETGPRPGTYPESEDSGDQLPKEEEENQTLERVCIRILGTSDHRTVHRYLKERFKIINRGTKEAPHYTPYHDKDPDLHKYLVFEIASRNGKGISPENVQNLIKYLEQRDIPCTPCREDGRYLENPFEEDRKEEPE